MQESLDPVERSAVALESIAQSLEKINENLEKIANKSPWDDNRTKALLGAALAETGMGPEVAARGFDVEGESNGN